MDTEINKNNKLIGICGNINSGKDLTGSIIQYIINKYETETVVNLTTNDFLNYTNDNSKSNWEIIKFADKLKDIICIILGCTREQIEDREFKERELGEEWNVFKYGNQLFVTYPEVKNCLSKDYWYVTKPEELELLYKNYIKNYTLTPRLLLQLLGTEGGREIIHPNIWCNVTFANYNENKKWIITDVRFENELNRIRDKNGIIIKIKRDTNKDNNRHKSEIYVDSLYCDYEIENNGTIDDLICKIENLLLETKIITKRV